MPSDQSPPDHGASGPPSSARVLAFASMLMVPVVLAGLWLYERGEIDGAAIPITFGSLYLAYILIARRLVGGLESLRLYADQLITGEERTPPEQIRRGGVLVRELGSAILRLRRAGFDQTDAMARTLKTREIVLDSMADPILTLDETGRILHANTAAKQLFGVSPVGRALTAVMRHPSILDGVQAVMGGEKTRAVDLRLSDPVERDFSINIQSLPSISPDGTWIIMVFHDVTKLLVAEQLRRDFVANVSHELRTPLATLIGFIETLLGPARDDAEARVRFLGIMQDQAQRMSRLVSDLLSLSRIELNEHMPPTERIDLNDLLRRTVAALQVQADKRGMKLDLVSVSGMSAVLGDADELQQLFQNLIDNALKYGRQGTTVTIKAEPASTLPAAFPKSPHGALSVAVIDQGEGIERRHLPRLIERFYRVDAARSKAIGGTGLGLAIVKHVVNRHRGALAIESELGVGSVFTVYLPAAPAL